MGVHGVIEFGNRLLTFVLGALAVAACIAAWLGPPAGPVRWSAARSPCYSASRRRRVIGGITVLTNLNPWVVGLHFLASMALIAAAYALWRRAGESDAEPVAAGARPLRIWPG